MSHAEQGLSRFPSRSRPLWQKVMCRWADRIALGRLTLHFPDGNTHVADGKTDGPAVILRLHNSKPFYRLLTAGKLGFSQSYLDGDWDTPDLGALLGFALANEDRLSRVMGASTLLGKLAYLRHRLRRNSRRGSRRNIAFHYDLGNDFYRLWLDETMTYSSALYQKPDLSLAEAQHAKYQRIIDELAIGPDDHILEIGCGWGGFAEQAIAATGCRVTGLTLSREQADFARNRLSNAGLSERADIRLEDYRDCRGQFDKIVSIEMFEAVGEENWPVYFDTLRQRMAPGGRAMLQSITIAEDQFDDYRRNADFIQTYVFPGGMLPSVTVFESEASAAGLEVRERFAFGRDYDTTLIAWDHAFTAHWPKVMALGFDERFYRMWRYYLNYCAVGFRSGRIDVVQFLLEKPAA
ncbi:MAG: class I SAM-dependent methyltransferase [Allorhizobium sp.]